MNIALSILQIVVDLILGYGLWKTADQPAASPTKKLAYRLAVSCLFINQFIQHVASKHPWAQNLPPFSTSLASGWLFPLTVAILLMVRRNLGAEALRHRLKQVFGANLLLILASWSLQPRLLDADSPVWLTALISETGRILTLLGACLLMIDFVVAEILDSMLKWLPNRLGVRGDAVRYFLTLSGILILDAAAFSYCVWWLEGADYRRTFLGQAFSNLCVAFFISVGVALSTVSFLGRWIAQYAHRAPPKSARPQWSLEQASYLLARDRESLLSTHPGQWVVYDATGRIAEGTSLAETLEKIAARGLDATDMAIERVLPWRTGKLRAYEAVGR